MTMLREFFDITKDSKVIFDGLAIMGTKYREQINSRPVIYFSFKDCKANTADELIAKVSAIVSKEYNKYYRILKGNVDETEYQFYRFFTFYEKLINDQADIVGLEMSIGLLERVLYDYYKVKPIVLIDEYDQPLISSYEHGYKEQLGIFFSGFFGAALKGQDSLYQAMLTGIQRVVKESIFSQLNNVRVYTVVDKYYSAYFGFNATETEELLAYYDLMLDESVRQKYDGYLFYQTEMYNPWSVLNYADTGQLENFWINTSTNFLVRKSIAEAGDYFLKFFDRLIVDDVAEVSADLSCSFLELKHNDPLWGLLINAGYITVVERINELFVKVCIPNGEVRSEFLKIVADRANVQSMDLQKMFQYLFNKDIDGFIDIYRELVICCTSYFDIKENAYHMLFLGMCISLNGLYKVTSNVEAGHGRSDIRLEALAEGRPHIIIEFKLGENLDILKEEALGQILDKEYYAGLKGEVLCVGIAHSGKRCEVAYRVLND
jgi:hypothetical protein